MPAIAAADAYCFAKVGLGCAWPLLPLESELLVFFGAPFASRDRLRAVHRQRLEAAHLPGLRRGVHRLARFGRHQGKPAYLNG